jgi:hypothetical protein
VVRWGRSADLPVDVSRFHGPLLCGGDPLISFLQRSALRTSLRIQEYIWDYSGGSQPHPPGPRKRSLHVYVPRAVKNLFQYMLIDSLSMLLMYAYAFCMLQKPR